MVKKYKIKTNDYYKERESLFYTCRWCGAKHQSKKWMKTIHHPCFFMPRHLIQKEDAVIEEMCVLFKKLNNYMTKDKIKLAISLLE